MGRSLMAVRTNSADHLAGLTHCLRRGLQFAWYRRSAGVGSHHILLALAAIGDPFSNRALVDAGVTCRAVIPVLEDPAQQERIGEVPVDAAAASLLQNAAIVDRPGWIQRWLLKSARSTPRRPVPPWTSE